MSELLPKYKPLTFFITTFVLTWGFWFLSKNVDHQSAKLIGLFLGLLSPFATALLLIFSSKNQALKTVFFNKLLNLRLIKLESIPAILLIPPTSIVISILISLLFGFSTSQFEISRSFSFSIGGIPTLFVLFLAASLEELGWRGYAMESLSPYYNYFKGTLIFGALWSLWHLPLFFIDQTYQSNILKLNPLYAINFMVGIIPLAFIISWLCKKNSGSIPAAIFLHFGINISQELFRVTPQTKCIQTFVLIAFALIIVYKNQEMFFYER